MTAMYICPYCKEGVRQLSKHITGHCRKMQYEFVVQYYARKHKNEYHGPYVTIQEAQRAAKGYLEAHCYMTDVVPEIYRNYEITEHVEFFYFGDIMDEFVIVVQRHCFDSLERLWNAYP